MPDVYEAGVRHWVWARPLSAPARQRSGWHAACAAQIICIRTRTCGSPARCSSFATSRALDVIKPSARRWAWAPPRKCAATNSCRLACGPRSCVSKAQNSHLPEFEAARQPHGRPSALVPPGASAPLSVGAAQNVRGPKLVPAGMQPVQLCQQGLEQSHA